MENIKQPNILVTGASRGIGQAIVETLKKRGANVMGHATSDPHLLMSDLSVDGAASILWRTALDHFGGRIDILINNAGVFEANRLDDSDERWIANWDRTLKINLSASTELSRLAVLHWQAHAATGRIVNIASRAAHRGDSRDHWHYAASKGAMVSVTKTIARAYAAQGIYAFAICPGFTMTGMAEDYLSSRGGEKLLADIPLGRVADPHEIATMAAFCALDAPPSMTGAVLDVNGASYVR